MCTVRSAYSSKKYYLDINLVIMNRLLVRDGYKTFRSIWVNRVRKPKKMKLQQLRYICEVAKHELNVSHGSKLVHVTAGISKQIRLLEDELGIQIFARNGKHLVSITPAGEEVLHVANEILHKVATIKQISQEFANETKGVLSIATTHASTLCVAINN